MSSTHPGPSDAFTDLFVQNERSLYGYVFSLVANHADTDDIVQRTLIQLWENFEKYDSERPFLPWAFRFAYRQVLMHRRSEKARRIPVRHFRNGRPDAVPRRGCGRPK